MVVLVLLYEMLLLSSWVRGCLYVVRGASTSLVKEALYLDAEVEEGAVL